jgi:hypothetical protein
MTHNLKMIFLSLALGSFAHGEITLSGYMVIGKRQLFVLSDKGRGDASAWLKLGDRYNDYVLDSYDQLTGILLVREGQVAHQLKLVAPLVEKAAIRKKVTDIVDISATSGGDVIVGDHTMRGPELEEYFRAVVKENPRAIVAIRGISPQDTAKPSFAGLFKAMKSAGVKGFILRRESDRD